MNGRPLRKRAGIAAAAAATTAGILTVGLVSGVAATASAPADTSTNERSSAGSGTSSADTSDSGSTDPMTILGGAATHSQPQGGSHGS